MTVLSNARWPEVAAESRRLLVVPLGSVEQHGPHLPMYTDTRIAVAVASRACADQPGVGLAPAVTIGASGEHAEFPGTLSIGTQALTLLLVELGRHASLHWPTMLLVNGHGGNIPAITSAIATLREEGRQCHVWHAGLSPAQLAEAGIKAGVADAHAGRFETSVMLALAPELVQMDEAAPGETRPVADIMPALRESGVRAVSPNGVLGDPTGASAAEGRLLLSALVTRLTETLEKVLAAGH
jgi:creatinine amidohydrolase